MNTPQLITHMNKYMQALYTGTPTLQTTYGSFQNYFNTTRTYTTPMQIPLRLVEQRAFSDGKQSDINLSLSSGTTKQNSMGL